MPEEHPSRKTPSVADLMRKHAADEASRQNSLHVVEPWNTERAPLWSPRIRCAVVAGTPWLDIYCPGCRTIRALDIRTLLRDRHPLASAGSLVIGLRCSWCRDSCNGAYACSHRAPRGAADGDVEQENVPDGISAR